MPHYTVTSLPEDLGGDILWIRDYKTNKLVYDVRLKNWKEGSDPTLFDDKARFVHTIIEDQELQDIIDGVVATNEPVDTSNMTVINNYFYYDINQKTAIDEKRFRDYRNQLLKETEWTQSADVTDDDLVKSKASKAKDKTNHGKAAWAAYRRALRNLSEHSNWPNLNPEDWPTPPDESQIPISHRP